MRERDNKLLIICFVIIAIATGVVYALLQADLKMVGTASIGLSDWDIHFNNLNLVEKKGKVNILSTSLSTATVEVNIELTAPFDSVLYTFDVINDGDLNAVISEIVLPDLEYLNENFVIYELTYENGDPIQIGDTLNSGVTKTLKLFIKHAEVDDPASLDQLGEFSEELAATILYSQA